VGAATARQPALAQKFLPVWPCWPHRGVAEWRRGSGHASTRRRVLLALLPAPGASSISPPSTTSASRQRAPRCALSGWVLRASTARLGQGLLGLWSMPLRLCRSRRCMPRLHGPLPEDRGRAGYRALPAAFVYYLTVAAADSCGCSLQPGPLPDAHPALAVALRDRPRPTGSRRGVSRWSWPSSRCPASSPEPWLDPTRPTTPRCSSKALRRCVRYLPALHPDVGRGSPGLYVRIAAWVLLLLGLVFWLRREARPRPHGRRGMRRRSDQRSGPEATGRPLRAIACSWAWSWPYGPPRALAVPEEPGPLNPPIPGRRPHRRLDGPVLWKDDARVAPSHHPRGEVVQALKPGRPGGRRGFSSGGRRRSPCAGVL
jgi:hypothetical protein